MRQRLSIVLTTWNVGGADGSGVASGADRLLLNLPSDCSIAVVGLQEVSRPSSGWKASLLRSLPPRWSVAYGSRYAGMRVIVLVHDALRGSVVPVQTMRTGTGVGDRWPNKGAVAVVVQIARTTVCFVVAHLAAQEGNLKNREEDYIGIIRRLQNDGSVHGSGRVPLFKRYDHVFMMGDLNYRLDPPVEAGESLAERVRWVEKKVEARMWTELAGVDELAKEVGKAKVLVNFCEGPLRFPPTFKFDPGSPIGAGYNAARVPSYCDRILWHSLPARRPLLCQTSYSTVQDVRSSDHVPVRATFELQIPRHAERPTVGASNGQRIVLEFLWVRFRRRKSAKKRKRKVLSQSGSKSPSRSGDVGGFADAGTARLENRPSGAIDRSGAAHVFYSDDDSSDDYSSSSSSSSSGSEDFSGTSSSEEEVGEGEGGVDTYDDVLSDSSTETSVEDESEEDGYMAAAVVAVPSPSGSSTRRGFPSSREKRRSSSLDCASGQALEYLLEGEGRSSGFDDGFLGGSLDELRALRVEAPISSSSDSDDGLGFRYQQSRRRDGKEGRKLRRLLRHRRREKEPAGSMPKSSTLVNGSVSRGKAKRDTAALNAREEARNRSAVDGGEALGSASSAPRPASGAYPVRSFSGPAVLATCHSENGGLTVDGTDEPVKRNPLVGSDSPKQTAVKKKKKTKKRSKARKLRKARSLSQNWMMDVHGQSVFLKPRRVYRAELKKEKDGSRVCSGDTLPAIPLHPVTSVQDLRYDHVQISFWRAKSRIGTCGALPLANILEHVEPGNVHKLSFDLPLTKYGSTTGLLEAGVQLVVSDSRLWMDGQDKVVRAANGGNAKTYYSGPLKRRKQKDSTKEYSLSGKAARMAQGPRVAQKKEAHRLDSLGPERGSSRDLSPVGSKVGRVDRIGR